ncbi:MAG: hypothetical protein RCG15_00725 [Candidatus Rickettsia vulgarisii]
MQSEVKEASLTPNMETTPSLTPQSNRVNANEQVNSSEPIYENINRTTSPTSSLPNNHTGQEKTPRGIHFPDQLKEGKLAPSSIKEIDLLTPEELEERNSRWKQISDTMKTHRRTGKVETNLANYINALDNKPDNETIARIFGKTAADLHYNQDGSIIFNKGELDELNTSQWNDIKNLATTTNDKRFFNTLLADKELEYGQILGFEPNELIDSKVQQEFKSQKESTEHQPDDSQLSAFAKALKEKN